MIYSDVPRISSNALNSLTLDDYPMLNSLIEYVLQNKDKDYIINFLSKLGVKYVILRHDLMDSREKQRLLQDIKNFEELFYDQKILEIGNFTIYKIPSNQIISVGTPTYCFTTDYLKIFKFDNVILNPFPADFILISDTKVAIFNSSLFITPKSIHYQADKYWSAGSVNGGWLNSFLLYLMYGIENFQLDYNNGLVFTWAVLKLNDNPSPNEKDLIGYWTFSTMDELRQWKNHTRENQFGSLYTLTLDNGVLKAELWNSTWGWKTINSPLIEAEYGNWYRWEFQIKAENAYGVHVKVAEYNQERKLISAEKVKDLGSETFNWQTVTIDYMPENPETRYIQLQIWHGHETTQPLPNRIWIDNVKIYDLKRFVEPVVLEIPFTIEENGEYVFFTRLFQNQRGGKIQIQLGNKNYIINTKDQLNKFVWKEIDTIRLEKGSHKIILTNLKGFNAVNLFALIPKQEYQKAQKQIEEILQDKRIIYILEAETDLYYQNATISNKYCGNASNGQVLQLNQASRVYSEIEIIKPGNYAIAIRAKGNLTIKIDEKEYKISSPQLNWTYIRPIHLERGKHKIEITNLKDQPSELDVVWLYSIQNKDENLEDILASKEIPAEIISYRKIDPTKYVVKVNATRPFMLSFAESYDPLWVAYINGEKIQSIPLYGVINGFWINQTGLLEITIEYEPQKWFHYGLAISLLTLTGCILYLTKEPLYRLISKIRKLKLTL
jgi:hypothetical protein